MKKQNPLIFLSALFVILTALSCTSIINSKSAGITGYWLNENTGNVIIINEDGTLSQNGLDNMYYWSFYDDKAEEIIITDQNDESSISWSIIIISENEILFRDSESNLFFVKIEATEANLPKTDTQKLYGTWYYEYSGESLTFNEDGTVDFTEEMYSDNTIEITWNLIEGDPNILIISNLEYDDQEEIAMQFLSDDEFIAIEGEKTISFKKTGNTTPSLSEILPAPDFSKILIGIWQMTGSDEYLSFNEDGTCSEVELFKWNLTGSDQNKLSLFQNINEGDYELTAEILFISNDEIVLDEGYSKSRYIRQSPKEFSDETNIENAEIIIGTWVEKEYGEMIAFYEDGTAYTTDIYDSFKWKLEKKNPEILILIDSYDGDKEIAAITFIDNNNVQINVEREVITMTRIR